jgi:hypothetical protein
MDWQFAVGIGAAVIFFFIPYAVKDMPAYVTWPGIVTGILFILWGMLPNHERIPIGPAILFIASISGIVASGLWYRENMTSTQPEGSQNFNVALEKEKTERPYIFLECTPLLGGVAIIPASGIFYGLNLFPWPKEEPGGGLQESVSVPGAHWNLPTEMSELGGSSYHCKLINYGAKPLFNVEMNLRLVFLAAEKFPNGSRSGAVTLDRQWKIKIPKIDIGSDKSFEFFPYSMSANFARVYFPNIAMAEVGGTKTADIIDVRTSVRQPVVLGPNWMGSPSK